MSPRSARVAEAMLAFFRGFASSCGFDAPASDRSNLNESRPIFPTQVTKTRKTLLMQVTKTKKTATGLPPPGHPSTRRIISSRYAKSS